MHCQHLSVCLPFISKMGHIGSKNRLPGHIQQKLLYLMTQLCSIFLKVTVFVLIMFKTSLKMGHKGSGWLQEKYVQMCLSKFYTHIMLLFFFSGICQTDDNLGTLINPLIEPMAISYLEIFDKASESKREFYGLRDFYRYSITWSISVKVFWRAKVMI